MRPITTCGLLVLLLMQGFDGRRAEADDSSPAAKLFAPTNLVAWCIVPFDANKRGPAERAEMVKRLGLSRVAYDWRSEHVATFEQEIEQYKQHGIEFFAFWSWHDAIEPLIKKHGIKPQIWMMLHSPIDGDQAEKVAAAAKSLLPMVEKTRELGLKLGIYNHGGWSGEPNNMVAVCQYLREHHQGDHVGIVYNFHHGHEHVADFPKSLAEMLPYLICLNLNGMAEPASVDGNENKILPIGAGKHERKMIQEIVEQGYAGPIGILDHRNELDSEKSLQQNLDGLEKLVGEAFRDGTRPQDRRNEDLQNLNGYFPFKPVDNVEQWQQRQAEIRRRILISQGLWPLPTKSPLSAVIHGRIEREDYVIDRVFFESAPGHFVTGSLYRPKHKSGSQSLPAILSPHGHWKDGRFYDAGEALVKSQVDSGAESSLVGGRYPIQARAVQLARMGCLVFVYDMTGNADAIQIEHRPAKWSHLDTKQDWGFMSVQAELRLQNMMGLQTWNSIRAIDFLLELDETDPDRIGVTGASGGGTQSMIIAAVDDRITAAMPCVMVSTAMQGGCTCENAPLMRIDQGNIDIAAAIAPRPLGLTAADDWTIELETKGYPDLVRLYEMLGHTDRLTAVFHTQFKHNYNQVNRGAMYSFFNRHFQLGSQEPIIERDYVPLSREEATVWTSDYPAPSGDQVGDPHEIQLLKIATNDSDQRMQKLIPSSSTDLQDFQDVVGGAWETILGRRLDEVGNVTFAESNHSDRDRYIQRVGLVDHADQGEQIPTLIFESKVKSNGTVIWITDSGKAEVEEHDVPTMSVRELIAAGFNVIAADLYGQGDSRSDDQPVDAQRMWYQRDGTQGWQRFSGYTYGYNHSLFAQRVHDILSLVKYAKSRDEGDVHLVGLGKVAGLLVAAARSQSGSAIADTVVDMQGFRFENLERHDDPMFVPGAVKYLDVDGILSLCAPAKLHLIGTDPSATAARVYQATESASSLTFVKHSDANDTPPIVEMIHGN